MKMVSNFLPTFIFVAVSATNRRCPTNLVDNDHLVSFDYSELCYEFITDHKKDWPHAKEDCALKGGSLVQINDMKEEDFIMSTLKTISFSGDGLWIGLSDQLTEGQFLWTNDFDKNDNELVKACFRNGNSYNRLYSGQPARFSYWGANQGPNAGILHFARDIEDCVALRFADSGHWHDYHCSSLGILFSTFGWICQYPILDAAIPSTTPSTSQTQPNITAANIVVG